MVIAGLTYFAGERNGARRERERRRHELSMEEDG
jgi:hypothetical protein